MKSFTAKEFSRCPAKVYEAAREDKEVEVTHDRFSGKFYMVFVSDEEIESIVSSAENDLKSAIDRNSEVEGLSHFIDNNMCASFTEQKEKIVISGLDKLIEDSFEEIISDIEDKLYEASNQAHKKATDIKYDDGVEFFSRGFMCRVLEKSSLRETIDNESKVGDIAYTNGYRVLLIEKAPS